MLISKFDLYKTEWLDLVFEDRNKAYGAYELRQHHAGDTIKAMGITFFGVALLCGASIVLRPAVQHQHHVTEVNITPVIPVVKPPVAPIKKADPPAHIKTIKTEATPATIKVVPPVVTVDNKAENPVKNDNMNAAIGQTTTPGKAVESEIPQTPPGNGTTPAPDNSIHTLNGLDFMPEPVGGEGAWAKFLSKNLRFPAAAQEDGVSGRVILSFVIEKDGSLSNITIDKPAGHGFDEEAMRVLKLAKAWKPGKQNGEPVRVRFTIPINFQAPE